MYRFLFSPRWLGFHLLVIVGIVTMVNLGFWQLRRLDERTGVQRRRSASASRTRRRRSTTCSATETDPDSVEWRSVTARGTYLRDEQFLVVNRSQGGIGGTMVVTPLQLADGRLLLVERGFQPGTTAAAAAPSGTVDVVGRLRPSEQRRTGQLSDPAEGELQEAQRLDIARLTPQLPGPPVPMFIELTASRPAEPTPYPAPVTLPELTERAAPVLRRAVVHRSRPRSSSGGCSPSASRSGPGAARVHQQPPPQPPRQSAQHRRHRPADLAAAWRRCAGTAPTRRPGGRRRRRRTPPARPGRGAAAPPARRRAAAGCAEGAAARRRRGPGGHRAARHTAGVSDRRGHPRRGAQRGGDGVAGGRVGVAGGRPEARHRASPRRQRPADGDRDALGAARRRRADAGGEPRGEVVGRDRRAGGEHGLLDEPAVGDRHRVGERRRAAGEPAGRSQVHQGGQRGSTPTGGAATTTPNAVWAAIPRGRRAPGGVDDEAGVDVAVRRQQSAAPAHVPDPLGVGGADVDPGGEVGPQASSSKMPYGPLDDVAPVAVDHDGGRRRREAVRRQVRDVVAPRAVRRRPRADRRRRRRRRARPRGRRRQRQARWAVTDDGEVDDVAGQWSSAAMRRNCSTTSGLRWVGSSVR